MMLAAYYDLPIVPDADGKVAAAAQRQPPRETIGQTEEALRSLDLTGELDSGKGRPLRMRCITVQPGGALALHNHIGRPAVTYMLQGEMTYYADGKTPVRAGDTLGEDHYARNLPVVEQRLQQGGVRLALLLEDIF